MMTMTMSSPHCRDHGLSGAGRKPATGAAAPFWASLRAITPIRLLSVPVWVCVHEGRFGWPARTESVPQPEQKAKSEAAGGTRSHRIRKRAGWDVSPAVAACVPSSLCAHVRAVITPRRRHYPSRRHLLHHMEASTIPGRSHPGLGSAGFINAVPSAGRARHSSLGLVIPSAQASPASLALAAPRYAKKSDPIFHAGSAPRDTCGLARRDTGRGSTIFSPVGTLPTIMRPREPKPIPSTPDEHCPTRRVLDSRAGRLNRRYPTQRGNHPARLPTEQPERCSRPAGEVKGRVSSSRA